MRIVRPAGRAPKGLIVMLAAAGLIACPARAETLADAVALAYRTNPTLGGARAQLRVSDEALVQAEEGYRPTATLSGGTTHQDMTSERYFNYQTATLSVSQPVFTGGRVGSRITAAQGDLLSGREELRRIEEQVLQSVIQAYVDVRRDEQAVTVRRDNVAILEHEVEESKARFAGGAITRTDVAQSQAGLAAARVELAQAQGQLRVSQTTYAAVVGAPPGTLEVEPPLAGVPSDLTPALNAAEANNPSLIAAKYAEQASRARVAEARAERVPQANVTASLGYEPIDATFPHSPYIRNFTVGVTASVPLYEGGALNSRIRQALDRNNADLIAIEGARRTAFQNLSQA
jgi:outer membrane protein